MQPESALSFYFWLVRMILWGQFPIDDSKCAGFHQGNGCGQ